MKETVDLGGGYILHQPKGVYPCGTDSVLLSAFAAENGKGSRFADLCTGSGIIPLLICKRRPDVSVFAVELSKLAAQTAKENMETNSLSQRVEIACSDVCQIRDLAAEASFDCVTVNPPYVKAGAGIPPKGEGMLLATQEIRCTARDIIGAAAYLLKSGGSMFMIHRTERKEEILSLLEENGMKAVLIRDVLARIDAKARVFLLHAVKENVDVCCEQKPLIMYENGAYTEEVARIYGK